MSAILVVHDQHRLLGLLQLPRPAREQLLGPPRLGGLPGPVLEAKVSLVIILKNNEIYKRNVEGVCSPRVDWSWPTTVWSTLAGTRSSGSTRPVSWGWGRGACRSWRGLQATLRSQWRSAVWAQSAAPGATARRTWQWGSLCPRSPASCVSRWGDWAASSHWPSVTR